MRETDTARAYRCPPPISGNGLKRVTKCYHLRFSIPGERRMNLHEYQAKALFRDYGMPVPNGIVATTPAEAEAAARSLTTPRVVVKAQVHAGGRGKAGGVQLVDSPSAAAEAAASMLGRRLVTFQTDASGQPVNSVLVEETCTIARELYLGAVLDRSARRITIMASTEGGMEIEKVAAQSPEKIHKTRIHPVVGLMPYQARELGFALGLTGEQLKPFGRLLSGLARLFEEKDLSLLEINPLVVTGDGELLCLDGKINIDGSALYRHPDLVAMRDESQEDPREIRAAQSDLNYVALDGNIGCMVNGAGLAMATMDIIKHEGGEPANFLDVGGGANPETVAKGFEIILKDPNVKAIFVNIFGGIVRCDRVANGILEATKLTDVNVPVIVRLDGTNAEEAAEILKNAGIKNIISAENLADGAKKAVEAAK